jgi:hypothetical protein
VVSCTGIDVLLPVEPDTATTAFIERYPQLEHDRWRDSIFQRRGCEFADIRHALRRFVAHQDNHTQSHIATPHWDDGDALHPLLALLAGRYPSPDSEIADYRGGVQSAFNVTEIVIAPAGEIPASLLENITPVCTENHIQVY